jgi:DNA-binding PadR family transcriptional regulator
MARKLNSSRQTETLLRALLGGGPAWRYGYDLSKETGLRSGTLYPILMRLEAQGWLETRWEAAPMPGRPPRHLYRLTPLGGTEANALLGAERGREAGVRVTSLKEVPA